MRKLLILVCLASANAFAVPCAINKVWTTGNGTSMNPGTPFEVPTNKTKEIQIDSEYKARITAFPNGQLLLELSNGVSLARSTRGDAKTGVQRHLEKFEQDGISSTGYAIFCSADLKL